MPGIDANTKIMLHCNGIDTSTVFTDDSPSAHTVTAVATAQIDTAESVFGGASGFFDGNSDYLTVPDSIDWDIFGSNSEVWTVDFRIKYISGVTTSSVPIGQSLDSSNEWFLLHNSNGLRFFMFSGGSLIIDTGYGAGLQDTNWHHVSIVIKGTGSTKDIGIYLDGVQIRYAQNANTASLSAPFTVGAIRNTNYVNAHIDEIRIQKSNYFSANPNVGLTDTITVPITEYTAFDLPQPPTTLVATTFDKNQIDLSWVAPLDTGSGVITGYKIERESPTGNGFSTLVADTGNTNLTFSDTGLTPNTQYNYRVSAITIYGTGDPSNENADTTSPGEPDAPTLLNVLRGVCGVIDLSWVAPIDNGSAITGYKIERESPIGGGFTVLVANTGNTNITYADTGLTDNTEYNYRVFAINAIGTSLVSNENDDRSRISLPNPRLILNLEGNDGDTFTTDSTGRHIISFGTNAEIDTANKKFGSSSLLVTDALGLQGISIPAHNDLDLLFNDIISNRMISFFVKQSSPRSFRYMDMIQSASNRWQLIQGDGIDIRPIFTLDIGGIPEVSLTPASSIPFDTNWHHISIVKIAQHYGLYLDGIQVAYDSTSNGIALNVDLNIIPNNTVAGTDIHVDEFSISHYNSFNANPNVGLTDTITVPTWEYCAGSEITAGGIEIVFDPIIRRLVKIDTTQNIVTDLFTGESYRRIN